MTFEGLGVPSPTGMIAKLKELTNQLDEQRLGLWKASEYGPLYLRFRELMKQIGVDAGDFKHFQIYGDCFHG